MHRREVIDDHMNDSNWKKLIDLGKFPPPSYRYHVSAYMGWVVNAVSRHYQKALSEAMISAAAFESINVLASPESVEAWSAKEEYAQREKGHDVKVMDIYDIKRK